jgi:hypothetical protein
MKISKLFCNLDIHHLYLKGNIIWWLAKLWMSRNSGELHNFIIFHQVNGKLHIYHYRSSTKLSSHCTLIVVEGEGGPNGCFLKYFGHYQWLHLVLISAGKCFFLQLQKMSWQIWKCCFISGLVADVDIESEKYRWMRSSLIDFYVCF